MSILAPVGGLPGFQTARVATPRIIFRDGMISGWLSGGKIIDGTKSRDIGNTGNIDVLRAGLLMGKITTSGKYANSFIGVLGSAYNGSGTSLTVSAAVATEIIRRIGSTGTLTLTGPPAANGTVSQKTATFSAVGATTVTITALSANEVQRVDMNIASTGGNVVLKIPKADGTFVLTTPAAWSATDATYLANIQAVLDVASGVANGIVVTAIPTVDTDLGFILTFSGTGYAGLPANGLVTVETLPTSSTAATVTRTTTGSDGRMVAGAFIGDTDGSQTPITFIPDGYGIKVTALDGSTSQDQQDALLPIAGTLIAANFLPVWPTDTSLQASIRASLKAVGHYVFDSDF